MDAAPNHPEHYDDPAWLEKRLYELCDHELARCNSARTPGICRAQSTPESLAGLREKIVRVAIRMALPIQDALDEVERELSFDPDFD